MNTLLIILIVLIYISIGIALSMGNFDYPALVTVLWFPILIIEVANEVVAFITEKFPNDTEQLGG